MEGRGGGAAPSPSLPSVGRVLEGQGVPALVVEGYVEETQVRALHDWQARCGSRPCNKSPPAVVVLRPRGARSLAVRLLRLSLT